MDAGGCFNGRPAWVQILALLMSKILKLSVLSFLICKVGTIILPASIESLGGGHYKCKALSALHRVGAT